ncbi:hypothetical protein MKX03_022098 [Papaver bracteatum]|nr:hypothetical protein MKX03_022098 [Papaver bracteatum]
MFIRKSPLPRMLLNNVSCMRNSQLILRNINASVHDGGALVLTGANGAGKSTFLRMLAYLSNPSVGEILWNGHDITKAGVFEKYQLHLNRLSFRDAVKEKFTIFFIMCNALDLMGLGRLINDKARMISMGQHKRLQLARVVALDRLIWLLDETSGHWILKHRKKCGIVFVATHFPIQIEDAMILRFPERFLRRKTMVDLLD